MIKNNATMKLNFLSSGLEHFSTPILNSFGCPVALFQEDVPLFRLLINILSLIAIVSKVNTIIFHLQLSLKMSSIFHLVFPMQSIQTIPVTISTFQTSFHYSYAFFYTFIIFIIIVENGKIPCTQYRNYISLHFSSCFLSSLSTFPVLFALTNSRECKIVAHYSQLLVHF